MVLMIIFFGPKKANDDDVNDDDGNDGNVQEVNRLRQEAQYFRLGGLLAQLTEAGPRLGVDGG